MSEPLSQLDQEAKQQALIAYVLMAAGLFTGAFWVIGAIWAMVKENDARGSRYQSHYNNMIRTFWLGLAFWIVGFFLTAVLIGFFILGIVWLWSAYKIVKGLAQITSDKAYDGTPLI